MSYRTRDWNEVLAKDLRDPEFVKEYVAGLLKDGWSSQDIIRRIVRAYGIKELALRVHLRPESISRVLRDPLKARDKTQKKITRPFGLKARVEITRELALI
jgi:hypothetical protein